MPYLRKSKPSANTPAPTPTSLAEIVQNLMSRKDTKALAASSATIALSIGSAFNNTRGASNDGATVQGMDAIGQTVYAAVRMAVEFTKESSDLCLPLKAIVGAMSALIKNYDVSTSCLQNEHALTLLPLPTLANSRQCGEYEGYRAEGVVAVQYTCLSCK